MFSDKNGVKGQLERMTIKLDRIEGALKGEGYAIPEEKEASSSSSDEDAKAGAGNSLGVETGYLTRTPTIKIQEPEPPKRDELVNPYWIEQVWT